MQPGVSGNATSLLSCGLPVAVAKQASQTLPALQFSRYPGIEARLDELVLHPVAIL